MKLETYKAVPFKDRLMQALEQIREVDKDIAKRIPSEQSIGPIKGI